MADYTMRYSDYWEQLIDNKTGKIILEGHHISALRVLELFGYTYNIEDMDEEE